MKKLIASISALVIALTMTAAFATTASAAPTSLTGVNLTVTAPQPGEFPEWDWGVCPNTSNITDYDLIEPDSRYSPKWYKWDRAGQKWVSAPNSQFAAGESYLVEFRCALNFRSEKYRIDPSSPLQLYVNGQPVNSDRAYMDGPMVNFAYEWTLTGDGATLVKQVDLQVTPPADGQLPSYEYDLATSPEAGKALIASGTEPSLVWYHEEGGAWTEMSPDEAFQAGESYSAGLEFLVGSGYYVKSDSTTLLVNGAAADASSSYADKGKVVESYTWPPVEAAPITEINLIVTEPVVGNAPDFNWDLEINGKDGLPFVDTGDLLEFRWYRYDSETDDWTTLSEADAFEAGEIYAAEIVFAFKDPYEADYPAVTALLVNGNPADSFGVTTEEYVHDSYTWPPLVCAHPNTTLTGAKEATCTEDGYTGDEICDDCGEVAKKGKLIPALGHDFQNGICTRCDTKKPVDPADPDVPATGDSALPLATGICLLAFAGVALAISRRVRKVQ